MSLLLKQFFTFLKLLNSETGTNQIAAGIAAGFILGMTPFFSLHSLILVVLILFLRVQIGAVIVATFFFAFPAYLLDPVFHSVGLWALEHASLQSFWTTLYNMPIIPFTRFNNTIVMGSGLVALLLSPIVFFMAKYLVAAYRLAVVARIKQTKAWKAFESTKFYKWYYIYDQVEWRR